MVNATVPGDTAPYGPSVNGQTKELRCQGGGKLLAEKAAPGTVIVCTRCKVRNEAD